MDFLRKYFPALVIGIVFFGALIFYSLNLPRHRSANFLERVLAGAVAPLQGPLMSISRSAGSVWDDYIGLVGVRAENKRLWGVIEQQNTRISEAQEAFLENQRLLRLVQLGKTLKDPFVSAEVIGEDVTPWFRTLAINRGSASGLREGMPVVADAGVVGQLVKVGTDSSRVLLLTDHASAVASVIQRSRARGVVKGKGEDVCSMEFSLKDEDVKVGDMVVTSGVGGVFPKGLPIGEVTMLRKGEYGIFQTIYVKPSVNISRLEEVLVLVRERR